MSEMSSAPVVRVCRSPYETTVYASLVEIGHHFTADDEAALLGFTHYYLAGWIARIQDGDVDPPQRWPRLTYEYARGSHFEVPVLQEDAVMVQRTIAAILGRSGARDPDATCRQR
jgi:hypothetical protein